MAIPGASETLRDGGLNFSEPVSLMPWVVGPSTTGDLNEFNLFADANALKDAHGEGVGILAAIAVLAKGGPIGFTRSAASVAGSVTSTRGAFTEDGTAGAVGETPAGSGPTLTVNAANATRSCDIEVEVTTAGTLGTVAMRYRVDAGAWTTPAVVPVAPGNTITIADTGVVVTAPAGTYVDDTVYDVAVTQGGGEITLSGSANYDADIRIEITEDGGLGEAKFRYSLDTYDGGKVTEFTFSEELYVPAGGTFEIPGFGVTLTFADEDFFDGDVYTSTANAAGLNTTDLASAYEPGGATDIPWRFVLVGTGRGTGDEAAHGLLATALQTHLDASAAESVYRRGIISTGGTLAADVLAEFDSVTAPRLACVEGDVRATVIKPLAGFGAPRMPASNVIAARASSMLLSTDVKRVRSGPINEVVTLFRDERANPSGLETIKVSTLRTYRGKGKSAYPTQVFLKSAPGSDFRLWPHGLVIDVACETAHAVLLDTIGAMVRTHTRTVSPTEVYPGVVDPLDAGPIEDDVNNALNSALITPVNAEGGLGHVQAVRYRISTVHNALSTGILVGSIGIKPFGYIDFVETDVGFEVETTFV